MKLVGLITMAFVLAFIGAASAQSLYFAPSVKGDYGIAPSDRIDADFKAVLAQTNTAPSPPATVTAPSINLAPGSTLGAPPSGVLPNPVETVPVPGPYIGGAIDSPTYVVPPATTISVGSWAGDVLTWLAAAFSVPIGSLLTLWIVRLFKLVGIQINQQMSDQLDDTLVRGLNAGAASASQQLAGKGKVEIKNDIVASAVKYAQDHRAETIKALGLDPQSGDAVQALRARIETLITDKNQPTPPILDPPTAPPAVPVPKAA